MGEGGEKDQAARNYGGNGAFGVNAARSTDEIRRAASDQAGAAPGKHMSAYSSFTIMSCLSYCRSIS